MKRTAEKLEEAIRLSLNGETTREIGRRLGVSARTVLRWLADPELKASMAKRSRLFQERKARDLRRRRRALNRALQQAGRRKIKAPFLQGSLL